MYTTGCWYSNVSELFFKFFQLISNNFADSNARVSFQRTSPQLFNIRHTCIFSGYLIHAYAEWCWYHLHSESGDFVRFRLLLLQCAVWLSLFFVLLCFVRSGTRPLWNKNLTTAAKMRKAKMRTNPVEMLQYFRWETIVYFLIISRRKKRRTDKCYFVLFAYIYWVIRFGLDTCIFGMFI